MRYWIWIKKIFELRLSRERKQRWISMIQRHPHTNLVISFGFAAALYSEIIWIIPKLKYFQKKSNDLVLHSDKLPTLHWNCPFNWTWKIFKIRPIHEIFRQIAYLVTKCRHFLNFNKKKKKKKSASIVYLKIKIVIVSSRHCRWIRWFSFIQK